VSVTVVTILVVNSGLPSIDRTVVVGLSNAQSGARIDVNTSTVSIIIMAHDHVAGLVGFNQTNVTISEGSSLLMTFTVAVQSSAISAGFVMQ